MLDEILEKLRAFNDLFKDESQRVKRLVLSRLPPVHDAKLHANKPSKPAGLQTPAGNTVKPDRGGGDVGPDEKPGPDPSPPGTKSVWSDGSTREKLQDGTWARVSEAGSVATPAAAEPASVNIDKPVEEKPAAGGKDKEPEKPVGGDKKRDEGGGDDHKPPTDTALSYAVPDPLPPDGADEDKQIAYDVFAQRGIDKDKVDKAHDYLRRFDYDFTESRPPSALRGIARRFNSMDNAMYAEADIANGSGINGVRHSFDLANNDLGIMADKIRRSLKDTLKDINYRVVRKNWTFQVIANTDDKELIESALAKAAEEVNKYAKNDTKLQGVKAREPKPGEKKNDDGVYLKTYKEELGGNKSKEILEDTTPLRIKDALSKVGIDERKSKKEYLTEAEYAADEMLKSDWSEKDIAENRNEITSFIEDTNLEGHTPSKKLREEGTNRLIGHVKEAGKPGTYVALDVHNLAGLTNHFESQYPKGSKEGRIKADERLKMVAGIVRTIVNKNLPKGATTDFFRYGGDEIAINIAGVSAKDVLKKIKIASLLVAQYVEKEGLSKLEHSKGKGHRKGFGFTFAVTPVTEEDTERGISGRTEKLIDAAKKGRRGEMAGSSVF
jgi:hypothetical protein